MKMLIDIVEANYNFLFHSFLQEVPRLRLVEEVVREGYRQLAEFRDVLEEYSLGGLYCRKI